MSASLPGSRELPSSQYDLGTYWGRVKQAAQISDPRTLFVSSAGLEAAKAQLISFKRGETKRMTPALWEAKKIVDSTIHPDTGEPVLLPFRMSCFVISNLVVTGGMLTPNLTTLGTVGWQVANQSLNVAINASNANKSSPLSTAGLAQSYVLAVSASCGVALGLNALVPRLRVSPSARMVLGRLVPFAAVATAGVLNVFLMRGEEIRKGIDVFPVSTAVANRTNAATEKMQNVARDATMAAAAAGTPASISSAPGAESAEDRGAVTPTSTDHPDLETTPVSGSLGKSKKAAWIAVAETAASRVFNATPIMVLPPLVLVRLQRTEWLKSRPRMVMPVNLGLILTTSIFALPLALGVFPQRQSIGVASLEEEFWDKVEGGKERGVVEFNRGI